MLYKLYDPFRKCGIKYFRSPVDHARTCRILEAAAKLSKFDIVKLPDELYAYAQFGDHSTGRQFTRFVELMVASELHTISPGIYTRITRLDIDFEYRKQYPPARRRRNSARKPVIGL